LGANRRYKDSLFRVLFNKPEKAVQLYGAVSGRILDSGTPVEMVTLKSVLLSKRRNDLAFVIGGRLVVLIEHQSTLNVNMPLRMLQYVLLFFEFYCELGKALYKSKMIKLPKPEFYVLYNGTEPYPERGEMRLSEVFADMTEGETPPLELVVKVININYDKNNKNAEVLEKSEVLRDYAIFVSKVRKFQENGANLNEAMRLAVKECLAEGVLAEFLAEYRNKEVINLVELYYDEDVAVEVAKEEAFEDGIEVGIEKGIEKGAETGKLEAAINMIEELKISVSRAVQVLKLSEGLRAKLIERLESCRVPYEI
jgi:predicted transposase YdaD